MENAIIIRTDNHFKSKELTAATNSLYKAILDIENGRKEACKVLAQVEAKKSYKEDGFSSLAEYGERIGLEKSTVHKMENAGRLLISDDKAIREFADKADYSKLSILASAEGSLIKKGIEDGTLTPDMTQDKVKAWKSERAPANKGVKVLRNYDLTIVKGNGDTIHYDSIAVENAPELDGYTKVGTYSPLLPSGEADAKVKWTVCVNAVSGDMLRYRTEKPAEEVKPAKSPRGAIDVSKLSTAQIETLLTELARRQGEGK